MVLVKPFSPVVLVERVKALLKRANKAEADEKICGNINIDDTSHTAYLYQNVLELTPKEYDLLRFFVENKGIILSRESILNNVWGFDYSGDLRTVDTHVKQLRAK